MEEPKLAVSGAGSETSSAWGANDYIPRASLSEQIAERLRDDIVHGRIRPGTHMIQDELCDRFGTSRMPVRDALQQLTHEGLLEQRGQQRIVVSLGTGDLQEAEVLIAVLHAWAAGQAARVASDSELEELAEICHAAVATDDVYEFGRLTTQFNRKINLLAHSPRLIRTLRSIEQTVPRTMPFTVPEETKPSKMRYLAILAAIQSRNAEEAERLTRVHSQLAVEWLMRSIETSG
jgi:DNA-binding GntR family transcriptional regulator